jgi:hypothetical protein
MQIDDQHITAEIWAGRQWVPLAQAVVEKTCPVMGLDPKQTFRLTMAVEEVVMHLAGTSPGTAVHMKVISGGWHVKARLSFRTDPSDLWALNLCAGAGVTEDPELAHLGLVLASRMTDRFSIRLEGGTVRLTLRQDLTYPSVEPESGNFLAEKGPLSIDPNPDPFLVKEACIRALGLYDAHSLHQTFFKPGKMADMVARKDMAMAVALTPDGAVAGAVCWQARAGRSLTFFGPYTFETGKRCAALLTEHMIQRAARTDALGLFSGRATSDLPQKDFECLGTLGNSDKQMKIWYRHLGEDPGTSVWSHPDLVSFLEQQYRDLILMRQIRPTQDLGEALPDRSVISSRLRPKLAEAVLVPLVGGRDMAGCLADHVRTLTGEGYNQILLQLDLALGWQAALGGIAQNTGFTPRLVLPYGGTSDIVVFQYESI